MELITFVVGCKGRLNDLQQTLPIIAKMPNTRTILVDYDCPQKSGDWVEKNLPGVQVIRVTDRPEYSHAELKNVGARAVQTPWICFTDADIRFDPAFADQVGPLLRPGWFYRAENLPPGTAGTILCTKAAFDKVFGYDELMRGWGWEDSDFVASLEFIGLHIGNYPARLISHIEHGDQVRNQHFPEKDVVHSWCVNKLYSVAKIGLMMYSRRFVTPTHRQQLYDWCIKAATEYRAGRPFPALSMRVGLEELSDQCPFGLKTSMVFEIEKKVRSKKGEPKA